MPKEWYYQEECERKQFEELRDKFDAEVLNCSELSIKLDATEKNLDQTSKLLPNTEEEVKRCQYAISEQDFSISELKKAENALDHQACVLRADLEKSLNNASLFSKIGREDKLNADNRSVVDNYQAELIREIRTLCNTVAKSISQQNEHLQCIEKFCNSFSDVNVKALMDVKKKVNASQLLYISHIEAMQNVVRLHKACSDAGLEEISTIVAANVQSVEDKEAREYLLCLCLFNYHASSFYL